MTEDAQRSYTVRLSAEEGFAAEELALIIGRGCGRPVRRSVIDRELWRFARENPILQDALIQRLGPAVATM